MSALPRVWWALLTEPVVVPSHAVARLAVELHGDPWPEGPWVALVVSGGQSPLLVDAALLDGNLGPFRLTAQNLTGRAVHLPTGAPVAIAMPVQVPVFTLTLDGPDERDTDATRAEQSPGGAAQRFRAGGPVPGP